jgi:hypothetical protein
LVRAACGSVANLLVALAGPQQLANAVGGLAGQRVGWVGVDARRGHLGMSQDALYDVDVHVQLAEQGSATHPRTTRQTWQSDSKRWKRNFVNCDPA